MIVTLRKGVLFGTTLLTVAVLAFALSPVKIYKEKVENWRLLSRNNEDELWISAGIYGWEGPRWKGPASPLFRGYKRITYDTWRLRRVGASKQVYHYRTVNDIAGLVAPKGDSIYVVSSESARWSPTFYRVVEDQLVKLSNEEGKQLGESFRYLTELYRSEGWAHQGEPYLADRRIVFGDAALYFQMTPADQDGRWHFSVGEVDKETAIISVNGCERPNREPTFAGAPRPAFPANDGITL